MEHDNTPKPTNVEIEFSFLLCKNPFILFIFLYVRQNIRKKGDKTVGEVRVVK